MAISASKFVGRGGMNKDNILHGSDLKTDTIDIVVIGVREAPPGFNSAIICDIEPVLDNRRSWPVNLSNVGRLARATGNDDLEDIVGRKIQLRRIRVNNPSTGTETWGLEVARVSKAKREIVAKPEQPGTRDDWDTPF